MTDTGDDALELSSLDSLFFCATARLMYRFNNLTWCHTHTDRLHCHCGPKCTSPACTKV